MTPGVPKLERSPGHRIRVAQQVHRGLWDLHVPGSLTSVQYAMLLVVAGTPGVDQSALGESLSTDSSTTADVASRLVSAQLLRAAPDDRDRRRKSLTLTPEGRDLLLEVTAPVLRVQEQLLAVLSAQQRPRLVSLLQAVAYASHSVPRPAGVRLPGATDMTLESAPGHLIRRAQQVHGRLWGTWVSRTITSPQYTMLLVLREHGELDQSTLGRHASLDRSTTAEVVARLANRRFLRCARRHVDGRRNLVAATTLGITLVEDLAEAVQRVQGQLLHVLSPGQREEFMELMNLICQEVAAN